MRSGDRTSLEKTHHELSRLRPKTQPPLPQAEASPLAEAAVEVEAVASPLAAVEVEAVASPLAEAAVEVEAEAALVEYKPSPEPQPLDQDKRTREEARLA